MYQYLGNCILTFCTYFDLLLRFLTYLELMLSGFQSLEQSIGFPVTGDESFSISIDDGRKYQVGGIVSHSFEVVRDTDETLHLSEILGLDLLKWRTELQLLLSERFMR